MKKDVIEGTVGLKELEDQLEEGEWETGSGLKEIPPGEEESEAILALRGMEKAKRAFEKFINEDCGLDGAYFILQLEVHLLDSSFTEVLEKIKWEGCY